MKIHIANSVTVIAALGTALFTSLAVADLPPIAIKVWYAGGSGAARLIF